MPITKDTTSRYFSNYIAEHADDRTLSSFARVTVTAASDTEIDPIGQPVIATSATQMTFYDNGDDISAVTASPLPDGSKVGIIVGPADGAHLSNVNPTTITAAGVEMTVMFRNGVGKGDNYDWSVVDTSGAPSVTPANAAEQAAFIAELEAQRVYNLESAEIVDPSYV